MPRGERLLLLAETTGYQTRVFAAAVERLGLELVLATDRCHVLHDPWADHAIPVRFEDPEKSESLLAAGRRCEAVTAVGDRTTYLAARIAARWGAPGHPPEAAAACRNKFLARERWKAAGLLAPEYFRVDTARDAREAAGRAPYPCVLKPLGLSASRGVIRANNEAAFVAAFGRIAALLSIPEILRFRDRVDRYIQVERFIEGNEYALEGLVTAGRLQVLALFDKPDRLDGPFFEETLYVTPSREPDPVQRAIVDTTQSAITALGLRHGPVHAEMRVNRRGVWMLEVAARTIGGLCARALRFDPEMTLEELVVRHALGEDVSGARRNKEAAGVMMIPIPAAGVFVQAGGVERAGSVAGIDEVIITAKRGQMLLPLPEGSSYLGFLFARGPDPEAVEASLRRAHAALEFEIAAVLPVVASGKQVP